MRKSTLSLTALMVVAAATGVGCVDGQTPDCSDAAAQIYGPDLETLRLAGRHVMAALKGIPGIAHTISIPGFSFLNGLNLSNAAAMFITLDLFEQRKHNPSRSAQAILAQVRGRLLRPSASRYLRHRFPQHFRGDRS
jgi:multidrug efflux pump subunit AcrB